MKSLLAGLLLVTLSPFSLGAVQGALGATSTGSFSITLVIPPKVAFTRTSMELNRLPKDFCLNGTGISHYSTSVMPDRITRELPDVSPVLINEAGQKIALNDEPVIANTRHCNRQLLMPADRNTSSDSVQTLLIAPE
ncbi:hypothetical protein [Parendozoicomonas haliclonae]|uniref:Uncharacterized protein n=1 Tax=Parendozoicomonas haliclonae TaxID=1960125 RepID=A0A1X7AGP0_9GAMM|nr:hypothetical protein [Parendozoicomonas haliclonae]SMA39284.1 hypothetical protein EHSB41UT_01001 [Parendozoicomonas haliclonae]